MSNRPNELVASGGGISTSTSSKKTLNYALGVRLVREFGVALQAQQPTTHPTQNKHLSSSRLPKAQLTESKEAALAIDFSYLFPDWSDSGSTPMALTPILLLKNLATFNLVFLYHLSEDDATSTEP